MLLCTSPASGVEDVAHHEHVDRGQRVLEEVAGMEGEALVELLLPDVALEHRLDDGKVIAEARQTRVGARDLSW